MSRQTIEEIFQILDREGCNPAMVRVDKYGFSRNIQFSIRGVVYEIEWWKNVSHLGLTGPYENYVRFTSIRVDTTWPSFSRGLALHNDEDFPGADDPVMRLSLKLLEWQEAHS